MKAGNFNPVRGFRALRWLARQDGGMAAVEFALILPILVVLWIGGVEMTQALSVDRRLNNLASAIGDLSARSRQLLHSDIDNIFNIAPGAMYPFCRDSANCQSKGLAMRVTAVDISAGGTAEVAWSRASGTTSYPDNQNVNNLVPETLRIPDSQIIMAEVYYTFTPAVGYVLTGSLDLDDRMFFVPRLTQYVKLCDNNEANCKS
jgi:Flp pilus assembly protein TadG